MRWCHRASRPRPAPPPIGEVPAARSVGTAALPWGMSSGESLRFSYKLSFARTVAMVLVAFAVPCGLAYIASANERPVRMFGLITLSPPQAATFFWTFAVVALIAAFIALWVVVRNHLGPQHVELGTTAAFVPKASLSRTMLSVPYAAIRRI